MIRSTLIVASQFAIVASLKISMMASTPGTIIGAGRIGGMLWESNGKVDSLVSRSDNYLEKLAPSGPIYISTRNKDLEDIINYTPKNRLSDLVFLQNGILTKYLKSKGLEDNTQALLYVAVSKKGEAPIDGPEGYTSVTGKWGSDFKERLNKAYLSCQVLDKDAWFIKMLEKHIWICAFMAVGAKYGVNVGEAELGHTAECRGLIQEMAGACETACGIKFPAGLEDRLCVYARAVAHFPTALKEFEWRNGWFLDLSFDALASGKKDPCPSHTDILLKSREVSVLDSYNAWKSLNQAKDSSGLLATWIVLNSKKYI